jgi:hypothetical protein
MFTDFDFLCQYFGLFEFSSDETAKYKTFIFVQLWNDRIHLVANRTHAAWRTEASALLDHAIHSCRLLHGSAVGPYLRRLPPKSYFCEPHVKPTRLSSHINHSSCCSFWRIYRLLESPLQWWPTTKVYGLSHARTSEGFQKTVEYSWIYFICITYCHVTGYDYVIGKQWVMTILKVTSQDKVTIMNTTKHLKTMMEHHSQRR